jgi:hypothetical protein
MSQTSDLPPFCGYLSNSTPLSEACPNRGTTVFNYRGGKLYLCDRHAGHLGTLIARKEEELRNCPYSFNSVAHALVQQLQHMIEVWSQ